MAAGRWGTCSRPTDLLFTLLFLLPPSSGVSLRGSGPLATTLRMVDVVLCFGLVWGVQWFGWGVEWCGVVHCGVMVQSYSLVFTTDH